MVGAWERELRARRLRAVADRLNAQAAERERAAAVQRAREAAMSRRQVVPPTRVVPEVRDAERRSFWDRLPPDVRKQVQIAILKGEDPRAVLMKAIGR